MGSIDDAPGLVCDDSDSIFSLDSCESDSIFSLDSRTSSNVTKGTSSSASKISTSASNGNNSPTKAVSKSSPIAPDVVQTSQANSANDIKSPMLQQIFKSARPTSQATSTEANPT